MAAWLPVEAMWSAACPPTPPAAAAAANDRAHTIGSIYTAETDKVSRSWTFLLVCLTACRLPASQFGLRFRSGERPERSRGRYGRVQSGNMTASSCSSSNGSSLFGLAVPLAPGLPHAARATAQANRLKSTRKSGRNQKENSNCAPAES